MSDIGINVTESVGIKQSIGPGKPPVKPQDLIQFNAIGLLLVNPKGFVRVVAMKPMTENPKLVLNIQKGSKFKIQEEVEVK